MLQAIDPDRGCFACMPGGVDRKTLFMVATEWHGIERNMGGGARTGQVLTIEARMRRQVTIRNGSRRALIAP